MGQESAMLQQPVRAAGLDYGQFERVTEAWAWLRDRVPQPARLRVIGDDDSDGVSSAYVLSTALRRAGYEVQTALMPIHSEADANAAIRGRADAYVVADSGSNLIRHFDTFHVPVLVIDHHRVHGHEARDVFEVNPRRVGGDKVRHASASILSLLFALAADEKNWDLGFAAIAGGISDRQHLGGFGGLVGYAVDGSVRAGTLTRSEGLTLVGQSVLEAVTESLDPFFDGLTGDAKAAKAYLEGLGIESGGNPLVMAPSTARHLAEDLTRRLEAKHVVRERMHPLHGERLLLRHASGVPTVFALAGLLEACTAERAHEVALRMLSGAVDARNEARTLSKHRAARILGEIGRLRPLVKELQNLRWVETKDEANTGVYAHTFLSFIHGDDRPFVVATHRSGLAKYSARGSPRLYNAGLDLSIAMADAAHALGGNGGGHPGASGASVLWEKREEFLAGLDRRLGELGRRPAP